MIVKIEDKDFLRELEQLQDEINSSQALLAFIINSHQPINQENFSFYEKKYSEQFKRYQQKKNELEERFIKPLTLETVYWNLDFKTGELKIDVNN